LDCPGHFLKEPSSSTPKKIFDLIIYDVYVRRTNRKKPTKTINMNILDYINSKSPYQGEVPKIPPPKAPFGTYTVTPIMARSWIVYLYGDHNRPFKVSNAERLAAAILAGAYTLTGEPVKFSKDDILLDGQHRLAAGVITDLPFVTDIRTNLEFSVFADIDTPHVRNGSHVLAIAGASNYTTVSPALRILEDYAQERMRGRVGYSNKQILALYSKYPGMDESATVAKSLHFLTISSVTAAAHYLFKQVDRKLCDDIFEKLEEGTALSKGDPILVLRERLIQNSRSKAKLKPIDIMALYVKAWNAKRSGLPMKKLLWAEEKGEPFPVITDLEPSVFRQMYSSAQETDKQESFVILIEQLVTAMFTRQKFFYSFIKTFQGIGAKRAVAMATLLSCAPERIRLMELCEGRTRFRSTALVHELYKMSNQSHIKKIIAELKTWVSGKNPEQLGASLTDSEDTIILKIRSALIPVAKAA
jgi:hypothetical protein